MSKQNEVSVLKSVFSDIQFFEGLGYSGYSFYTNSENGIPDGFFKNKESVIWIEHSEAKPNYGKKKSHLEGSEGFCERVQERLFKDGVRGCICFDISNK